MGEIQIVFMIRFGFDPVTKAILCDKSHNIPVCSMSSRWIIFVKAVNKALKRKH